MTGQSRTIRQTSWPLGSKVPALIIANLQRKFALLDFDVQRFTKRCASQDRDLEPGEEFYSVLLAEGGDIIRKDYSVGAWSGPPENAIGWWKSEVPDPKSKKMHWAPNDVLLHYFQQLEDQPHKQDVRYVLTLLLIRKRILRLEESVSEDGNESMVVYCHKTESEHSVAVQQPTADRIQDIQNELAELLFAKGS